MKKVREVLESGYQFNYADGEYIFTKFFTLFKKSFTKILNVLRAEDIVYNKGHFYISGFFTVDNQAYYFSLGDVRQNDARPKLLIRTADNYSDYSGGANNYFPIYPAMYYNISDNFKIYGLVKPKNFDKDAIVSKIIDSNGIISLSVSSAKRANSIMSAVLERCNIKQNIWVLKYGRCISRLQHKGTDKLYFDFETKRLDIELNTEFYVTKRKLETFLDGSI